MLFDLLKTIGLDNDQIYGLTTVLEFLTPCLLIVALTLMVMAVYYQAKTERLLLEMLSKKD